VLLFEFNKIKKSLSAPFNCSGGDGGVIFVVGSGH